MTSDNRACPGTKGSMTRGRIVGWLGVWCLLGCRSESAPHAGESEAGSISLTSPATDAEGTSQDGTLDGNGTADGTADTTGGCPAEQMCGDAMCCAPGELCQD